MAEERESANTTPQGDVVEQPDVSRWGGNLKEFMLEELKKYNNVSPLQQITTSINRVYQLVGMLEAAFIAEKQKAFNDAKHRKITDNERAANFDALNEGIDATKRYITASLGQIIKSTAERMNRNEKVWGEEVNVDIDTPKQDYRKVIEPLSLGEKFMLLIDQFIEDVSNIMLHHAEEAKTEKGTGEHNWNFGRYPVKQTTESLIQAIDDIKKEESTEKRSDEDEGFIRPNM